MAVLESRVESYLLIARTEPKNGHRQRFVIVGSFEARDDSAAWRKAERMVKAKRLRPGREVEIIHADSIGKLRT